MRDSLGQTEALHCPLLVVGAVPVARARRSGLLPSAGQEARLGGDPGCKGRGKTPLWGKAEELARLLGPPGASLSTCLDPRPPG